MLVLFFFHVSEFLICLIVFYLNSVLDFSEIHCTFLECGFYYSLFVLFCDKQNSSAVIDTVNPRDLFYVYGGRGGPCACMSIHIWGCGEWCDIDSCSISKNMHVSIDRQTGRCWAGSLVNCPLEKHVDDALPLCGCSHFYHVSSGDGGGWQSLKAKLASINSS